jgi:hypothetical protein
MALLYREYTQPAPAANVPAGKKRQKRAAKRKTAAKGKTRAASKRKKH